MSVTLSVVYADGNREDIPIRVVGLVAAERKFGGNQHETNPIEATLYAGWMSKGRPLGSFDDWVETVADVEEREEPARPLAPEPSPEPSPA